RVRDLEAGPGLRAVQVDRRAPRDPDLRPPRPPRARAGRARGGAPVRVAEGAGADDRRAPAHAEAGRGAGRRGRLATPRTAPRSEALTSWRLRRASPSAWASAPRPPETGR